MNTALAVDPDLPRRRLDVHEYHRMGEAGILTEDDRVELIDGEIIEMTPIGDPHVDLVIVLHTRLSAAIGPRAEISVQNPSRLDDRTEPRPDLAVLRLDRRRGVPLARDALLVSQSGSAPQNPPELAVPDPSARIGGGRYGSGGLAA